LHHTELSYQGLELKDQGIMKNVNIWKYSVQLRRNKAQSQTNNHPEAKPLR